MKHSKTFSYFNNIINQCESDHLLPLSRAVNEFLKLPTNDSLASVNKVFGVIETSISKIAEELNLYISSGNLDISEEEKQTLHEALSDLHDNVRFEVESLKDVIRDQCEES